MRKSIYIYLLVSISWLYGCKESSSNLSQEGILEDTTGYTFADEEPMEELIPLVSDFLPEVIVLLEEIDQTYHQELLDTTININIYTSNIKKAMNLGVYSTDLMYACINRDTLYNERYVKTINAFARQLEVVPEEERLIHFKPDADSLLYDIIQQLSHDQYHQYFAVEKDKVEYSFLVSMGAWVEFLHICCQVYAMSPSEELRKQIAEQKIYLSNLSMYISFYDDNAVINTFRDDFEKLLGVYEDIIITYQYQEPTTEIVDDMIVTIQHDIVDLTITEEQLQLIAEEIEKIREVIIHPEKV